MVAIESRVVDNNIVYSYLSLMYVRMSVSMFVCTNNNNYITKYKENAVIRATSLCLRGSRVRWRSATSIDGGAGLPNVPLV